MLAEDERLGYSVDTPITPMVDGDGYASVCMTECDAYPNMLAVRAALADGSSIILTDYASAGKVWNNGKKMAVWLLTD